MKAKENTEKWIWEDADDGNGDEPKDGDTIELPFDRRR